MRIAVVGCGPKGLAALVELEKALASPDVESSTGSSPSGVVVDVFEPFTMGSGAVWSTLVPAELLMNVSPSIVDFSCPSFPYSYVQWAQKLVNDADGSGSSEDASAGPGDGAALWDYPPRLYMGWYLQSVAHALTSSRVMGVNHVQHVVRSLEPKDGVWRIHVGPTDTSPLPKHGSVDEFAVMEYQHVLLATGHRSPLGVDDYLRVRDPVTGPPSGSDVGVRGAALTAIDFALLLTEGRGGHFHGQPGVQGSAPLYSYVPGGSEPASITFISRSGVPMSAKPARVSPTLQHLIAEETKELLERRSGASAPNRQWWEGLIDAAWRVAESMGYALSREDLERTLFTPETFTQIEQVLDRMTDHLAMNHGDKEPDAQWLWGRVWNCGYQNIIDSLNRAPRQQQQWEKFRKIAATAERWAYGPPETTVAKLIALTTSGRLRWEQADSSENSRGVHRGASSDVGENQMLMIDAVTQGPGVREQDNQHVDENLWKDLLEIDAVTVRNGERGVFTDENCRCLSPGMEPTPGLYALGRPTEDAVIGNDTLNHALHGDAARWAQHIADTLRQHQEHP